MYIFEAGKSAAESGESRRVRVNRSRTSHLRIANIFGEKRCFIEREIASAISLKSSQAFYTVSVGKGNKNKNK